MRVIDSQVHAYERDHPGRPWHAVLHGPEELTGGDMVAAMDAAGVDGALLVSPFTMYRYDASYALEVGRAHADRCAVIAPFDPDRDDVAGAVAAFADEPGTVGVRLILWRGLGGGDAHEGVDRIFVAGGFAEVTPAGLTILAEEAIPLSEIDADKLAQDLADAVGPVAHSVPMSALAL